MRRSVSDRPLYYSKLGEPLTLDQWVARFNQKSYQVIRQTALPDGGMVSTVWLGLDHGFGPGPPVIFETMVFWPDTATEHGGERECRRYTTLADARKGHAEFVKMMRRSARKLDNAMRDALGVKRNG